MNPDNIELHDALLERIEISVGKISISIQYFPDISILAKCHSDEMRSKYRKPLLLEFDGVQESNLLTSHSILFKNKEPGNVVSWSPNWGDVTYIVLEEGFISVKAKTLNVLFPESTVPSADICGGDS